VGLSHEATAAFVLLKRAKEVVWIAFGYGLLAALRRPGAATALSPPRVLTAVRLRWLPRSV
jgi:hypothetical protein